MATISKDEQAPAEANAIRRVVVGVDESPSAANVLRWALQEAASRRVPCVALRVVTPLAATFSDPSNEPGWLDAVLDDAAQAVRAEVERASADASSRPPAVDIQARIGFPGTILVDAAPAGSLLVVGSRGLSRVGQVVLGSVSRHVIEQARCPVVVLGPRVSSTGADNPMPGSSA